MLSKKKIISHRLYKLFKPRKSFTIGQFIANYYKSLLSIADKRQIRRRERERRNVSYKR